MKTGVIVGRFQIPYLHEGHKKLIDTAIAENDLVFILIGHKVGDQLDERNPYTFGERHKMIAETYPKVLIGNLEDCPNDDEAWSRKLDRILDDVLNPTLYGSRDSFYKHYKGIVKYREIEEVPDVSATKIREQLKNEI
jgi:bifunctional NMN adenylyltransferase/nudix hydrolase